MICRLILVFKCLRVFDYTVLVRILVLTERNKSNWRKLHNEELKNFNSSPDIFRMIKQRQMRWTRHVAPTGKIKHILFEKH